MGTQVAGRPSVSTALLPDALAEQVLATREQTSFPFLSLIRLPCLRGGLDVGLQGMYKGRGNHRDNYNTSTGSRTSNGMLHFETTHAAWCLMNSLLR